MSIQKIYTNTLAQIASKIITAIISIYLIALLGKFLGVAGFGVYSKIYNYLGIFAVIGDLGLYAMSVRELTKHEDNPKKQEEISANILSLRLIFGIVIIFLAIIGAFILPGYHDNTTLFGIIIVGFFTLFGLLNSSIMSYLQAIYKTEFSLIANTVGKIITLILIILATKIITHTNIDNKILWVFGAGLLGNITMFGLTTWYASKFQKIRFAWDTNFIKNILSLSMPYGLALFLGVIFFKVDVILLSILSPQHMSDKIVGLYSLPMKIIDVGMMYGTIFLNSVLPMLTLSISQKKHIETQKLSQKGFEILMLFGAGISIFIATFPTEIITFISSNSSFNNNIFGYNSSDILRILSWVFLFYFLSSLSNYILIAKNEQKKIIFVNLFIATFNIIGNIITIPYFSSMGSATVTVISQILLMLICAYLVRKELNIKTSLVCGIIFGAFACISAGISYFFVQLLKEKVGFLSNFQTLLIAGILFGILYLGSWLAYKRLQKNPKRD